MPAQPKRHAPFVGLRRPPKFLPEGAKQIWRDTIDLIPGLILELDTPILALYCSWRDILDREQGKPANKATIDLCRNQVTKLAEQFGLTPASRLQIIRRLKTPARQRLEKELRQKLDEMKPRRRDRKKRD